MQWAFNEDTETLEMDFEVLKQLIEDTKELPLDDALSMLSFQLGDVNLTKVKTIVIKDVQF